MSLFGVYAKVHQMMILFFTFRLTKAEQEVQQSVVKAEIVAYPQNRMANAPTSSVKTAVCNLQ